MQLELEHISKRYKDKLALEDVCVTMNPGVNGLLGPNGAGKSTLMGILTKNLMATSGIVRADGKDISRLGKEYMSKLGFAPQQQNMYPSFTGIRFMYYMAALKEIPKKEAKPQIETLLKKSKSLGGCRAENRKVFRWYEAEAFSGAGDAWKSTVDLT